MYNSMIHIISTLWKYFETIAMYVSAKYDECDILFEIYILYQNLLKLLVYRTF